MNCCGTKDTLGIHTNKIYAERLCLNNAVQNLEAATVATKSVQNNSWFLQSGAKPVTTENIHCQTHKMAQNEFCKADFVGKKIFWLFIFILKTNL